MSDEKLLPCPFCGRTGTLSTISAADFFDDSSAVGTAVYCSERSGGCGATGGFIKTGRAAREKWNTRTPPISFVQPISDVDLWESIENYGAAMQSMVGARLGIVGYPTSPYAEERVQEAKDALSTMLSRRAT